MKLSIRAAAILAVMLAGVANAADDVATRVAAIEDRLAIERLVLGDYPRALDERRLADYAALFTADGELLFSNVTLKGPAAIQKFLSTPGVFDEAPKPGQPAKPPSPLRAPHEIPHIISNPSYRIDGTIASGGAYWTEVTMVAGHPQVVGTGRYVDVLRKENGQWKFAKRTILRDVPPEAPRRGAATKP